MAPFAEVPLLVAFADLTRYAAHTDRLDDAQVAQVMDRYYELAGTHIAAGGGRVVKFIGDATLAVFPPDVADRGVIALLDLKQGADRFMTEHGWDCQLVVKVHYGPVAAGDFGPVGEKRYDVLGKTVNVTARLESSGVALSVEAFRQLGPDLRQRFRKHTPPVTYIRQEDSHRERWAKRR